jgi:hypothetical protein
MSSFRTEFSTGLNKSTIPLNARILTIGSCFADGIGEKFLENKFQVLVNPFGTVYNPLSIHKLIGMAIRNQNPAAETYLINDEVHCNYDFHSSFSAANREQLQEKIKNAMELVHSFLVKCDFLFITYGTSWVYQLANGQPVANCHKQPAESFNKTLLDQQTIAHSFKEMYEELKKINPAIKIILTLSPIRHIKDTLPLNAVSKSVLRVVCHELTTTFNEVEYFPAYEIMMDDLRDYRFYTSDMIHPNADAVEYIWNKFSQHYFTSAATEILEEWQRVKKMMAHRPFHPKSASHQKFLKGIKTKLEALQPKLNVSEELKKYT